MVIRIQFTDPLYVLQELLGVDCILAPADFVNAKGVGINLTNREAFRIVAPSETMVPHAAVLEYFTVSSIF